MQESRFQNRLSFVILGIIGFGKMGMCKVIIVINVPVNEVASTFSLPLHTYSTQG